MPEEGKNATHGIGVGEGGKISDAPPSRTLSGISRLLPRSHLLVDLSSLTTE
jgi:hypothetical protein